MRNLLTFLLGLATLFAADAPRRAPGFSLPDGKGAEHDLADYRGKVVLLAFTQTTCPHCANFAQKLQQIHQKYGDKVAVIAVVDPPDDPAKVAAYVQGHALTYPILFDCGQMAYSYVLSQNLDYPRLYLIDAGGTIRGDYQYSPLTTGIFEGDKLPAEVDRLLPGVARPNAKK